MDAILLLAIEAILTMPTSSGLTHGVVPLLIALARPGWWPVAVDVALGIGLHVRRTCFPTHC